MRETKTLTVDIYEKRENGSVYRVGMISPQEAFDTLKKHLEKENLLPDEYFIPCKGWHGAAQLPNYEKAICEVEYGVSEGIYLNIFMVYEDGNEQKKWFPFATGKTLDESGDSYLKMSRIGAECSMMLNGRGETVRFKEVPKKAETILIDAMLQYGLAQAWGDIEVIEALLELGITEEDFKEADYGEFFRNYSEVYGDAQHQIAKHNMCMSNENFAKGTVSEHEQ